MTSPTTAVRVEAAAQVTIMLIMGVAAACASFTHIHDLTVRYGQQSWIGWANAVVVELMSIAAGLELRRRKRTGQHTGFVYAVLYAAALVSLAAQVAEAQPSMWGWIVAALPAIGFLAVVKIVLSRAPATTEPDRTTTADTGPDHVTDRTAEPTVRSTRTAPTSPAWSGPDQTPDRTGDHGPTATPPARTSSTQSGPPTHNSDTTPELAPASPRTTTRRQRSPGTHADRNGHPPDPPVSTRPRRTTPTC